MKEKDPEHIGVILKQLFRDQEWEKHLEASLLLLRWQELVGSQIAQQSQPEFIKDGVLQVRVENSVWLNHLRFLGEELRRKLNEKLSPQKIKEIRFRQGPLDLDQPVPSTKVEGALRSSQTPTKSHPPLSPEQLELLERLEIALWPEFDRSAVLVIYRFELPSGTALPATVALPLPAEAGEPHAVAWQDESGNLLLAQYTRRVEGEWATVFVEAESLIGQVEYYAELGIEGDRRDFRFQWPGGPEISSLGYEIQQPIGSSAFVVSTSPAREGEGAYGLTYAYAELGQVGASETPSIELSYMKTEPLLSFDAVQPPQPQSALGQPETPTSQGSDLRALVPWVVGLGVLLLVAGLIWYVRLSRPAPTRSRSPRRPVRSGSSARDETEASPVYCHQCGTKGASSDAYCRQCGTKLRGR